MNRHSDNQESGTEYNWHPKVHTHKGEGLWFFLIRFKDPTLGAVEDQISSALEKAGIPYACKYTLYGYWDALIRVWMTEAVRRRFLDILKKRTEELGIEESRYFEVSGLYYLWHDVHEDLLESGPAVEKLNAFEGEVQEAKGDSALLPADQKAEMLTNELLIERPGGPDDAVKFYVTLEYTAGSALSPEQEVTHMLRAIEAGGLAERCSLYVGYGCARFFLRCAADDFSSVLGLTQRLYRELRDLHKVGLALRPTTYIIVEASAESDNMNFFGSLSLVDQTTAERLGLTAAGRARFTDMTQEERSGMHSLVRKIDQLSLEDERLSPKLTGLLRACIEEDVDGVVSSYAFVFDFEWLFREYMIRVWASRYPGDWPATLAERLNGSSAAGKVSSALGQSPSEWTFGTVHKLAEMSGRDDAEVQGALVNELGDDWHGKVKALVGIRNFAAHSSVRSIEQLSDLSGEWGARVREIIESAEFYFRLDKLLRRKEAKHDYA